MIDEYVERYLQDSLLPEKQMQRLNFQTKLKFLTKEEITHHLVSQGIKTKQALKLIIEAAQLSGLIDSCFSPDFIILSDGARQFDILNHALCWVHAERPLRALPENETQKAAVEEMRKLLWEYNRKLKEWKTGSGKYTREELSQEFDEIFSKRYEDYEALNEIIEKLDSKKEKLLLVLEHPFVPLHTNASENDIREIVTKRKVSGGTRSEAGRTARDTLMGLKKNAVSWMFLFGNL